MKNPIEKHLHWQLLAYDEKTPEGNIAMPNEIVVLDVPIESMAIEEAKKLVKRKFYHLVKVWECKTCGIQEEQIGYLKKIANSVED